MSVQALGFSQSHCLSKTVMEISTQGLFPALLSAPPSSQALLNPKLFCWSKLQAEGAWGTLRLCDCHRWPVWYGHVRTLGVLGIVLAWSTGTVPHRTGRSLWPQDFLLLGRQRGEMAAPTIVSVLEPGQLHAALPSPEYRAAGLEQARGTYRAGASHFCSPEII